MKKGHSLNEKKKEQMKEILFSRLQDLHGKKRYVPPLLRFLVVVSVAYTASSTRHYFSYETYPVFLLLLFLVGCLGIFAVEKYVTNA